MGDQRTNTGYKTAGLYGLGEHTVKKNLDGGYFQRAEGFIGTVEAHR